MSNPKPYRLTSISEKGVWVKEINRLDPKPIYHPKYYDALNRWKAVEESLQTFEIDKNEYVIFHSGYYWIHSVDAPVNIGQALTGDLADGKIVNVKLKN